MMGKTKGIYGKYKIEKTDGTPIDPDAKYFVLRIDTDPHARVAAFVYAQSIQGSNPDLARDLARWVLPYLPVAPLEKESEAK